MRTRQLVGGIDWSLTYTGEVFGLSSGGAENGAAYEHLIGLEIHTNLSKLVGWTGGSTHVSVYQIDDGSRNAADLVGAISDPSNIDARPTFRLFTLWAQQELGHFGSLRIGQIAADDEFLISKTAAALINSAFGWPEITAADLPGGGPVYPLATPGARLQLGPTDSTKAMVAVFSGNPAGDCPPAEDPQACNPHGTTFSFTGGALFMGELQYRAKPSSGGVSGTAYRFGGWYHTGDFADQEFGNIDDGSIVSLADDPASPIEHQGNWGLYAVVDQVLWQSDAAGITGFWRGGIPPPDRNFISWYVDGGFGITGQIANRPNDVLTFGIAHSNVSREDVALERTTRRLFGYRNEIRRGNTVFELNYTATLGRW